MRRVLQAAWAAMLLAALAACSGWDVDPNRPPLKDYEPPPIDGFPGGGPPSRV